jgi:hypothetical protein
MAQVLSKEYECLTCHKPIKISKMDNTRPNARRKWEHLETDGVTPRQCMKEFDNSLLQTSVDDGPHLQIAELAKQVSDLEETVKVLISQTQILRSDVKKTK